jgi:hypothetical protein
MLLERVKKNLMNVNYDGSLLKPNDLLLAIDRNGEIAEDNSGNTLVIVCNFERIWKCPEKDVP